MPAVTSPAAVAALPATPPACRTWPPLPSTSMSVGVSAPSASPWASALASRSLILHNIPAVHSEASLREQLRAFGDVLATSGPSHGTFLAAFFSARAAETARKHLSATTPPTSLLPALATVDPLLTHGTVLASGVSDSSALTRKLAEASVARAAVRSARPLYQDMFVIELWDTRDARMLVSMSPAFVPAASPPPADDLDADLDHVLSDAEADLDAAWPALLRDEASSPAGGAAAPGRPFVFEPSGQPPEPPRLDLLGHNSSASIPTASPPVSAAAAVACAARAQERAAAHGSPPFSPVTMPRFSPGEDAMAHAMSVSSSAPVDLRAPVSAASCFTASQSSPRLASSAPTLFGRDGSRTGPTSPAGSLHAHEQRGSIAPGPFGSFHGRAMLGDELSVINGIQHLHAFPSYRTYDSLPIQRLAPMPNVHPARDAGPSASAAAHAARAAAQAHGMEGMRAMHVVHGRDGAHVVSAPQGNPSRAQVPVSAATTFAGLVQSRPAQAGSGTSYGSRRDSPPPTRARSTPTTPRRCGSSNGGSGQNTNGGNPNPKFALFIEKVKSGGDTRTALMIRNIPNKYSAKMLQAALEENHRGKFDFLYLPIDFKNKCNVGYAFINFTSARHIVAFYSEFHGRKWGKFNSDKICEITYARIQGKQQLVNHFSNSSLMNEDPKCRPLVFGVDGKQEEFPVGMHVRTRRGPSARDASAAKTGGDHGVDSPSFSPGRHRGRCH